MASTDPSAAPRKKKMVKRKPARQQVWLHPPGPRRSSIDERLEQVEVGQIKMKAPEQTGQTFNVWYGKWVSTTSTQRRGRLTWERQAGGDKYDSYGV